MSWDASALYAKDSLYDGGKPSCLSDTGVTIIVEQQGMDTNGFSTCTAFNDAFGTYTVDMWSCSVTDLATKMDELIDFCSLNAFNITSVRKSSVSNHHRVLFVLQKSVMN